MARASHTPVPYWLQLPIRSFFRWINAANEVEKEDEEERKRLVKKK
jgi:hypothetical protein